MKNAVKFAQGKDVAFLCGLFKYDYGQQLIIEGLNLPDNFEVHFQTESNAALVVKGCKSGNEYSVSIPDEILQQEVEETKAWIYLDDKKSGKTIKTIVLHLNDRDRPSDMPSQEDVATVKGYAEYVKENAEKVSQAQSAGQRANEIAEQLLKAKADGEFNGPPGKDAEPVPIDNKLSAQSNNAISNSAVAKVLSNGKLIGIEIVYDYESFMDVYPKYYDFEEGCWRYADDEYALMLVLEDVYDESGEFNDENLLIEKAIYYINHEGGYTYADVDSDDLWRIEQALNNLIKKVNSEMLVCKQLDASKGLQISSIASGLYQVSKAGYVNHPNGKEQFYIDIGNIVMCSNSASRKQLQIITNYGTYQLYDSDNHWNQNNYITHRGSIDATKLEIDLSTNIAPPIVNSVYGTDITINEAATKPLVSLLLKGYTQQESGKPSPDNILSIENAGIYNEATQQYDINIKVFNQNGIQDNITLSCPQPLTQWDSLRRNENGKWGWYLKGLHMTLNGTGWTLYDTLSLGKGFLRNANTLGLENSNCRDGYCNQCTIGNINDDESDLVSIGYPKPNSSLNYNVYLINSSFYDETLADKGLSNLKAHLNQHPLEIWTYKNNAVFYELSESEQAELNLLYTYVDMTRFLTSSGVMEISYICDTKKYVDSLTKIEEKNESTIELKHNSEQRQLESDNLATAVSLTLALPETIPDDYISGLVFKCGDTPVTLSYPESIVFTGDDVTENVFVPDANKAYNVIFWYDGININAVSRGVPYA